MSTSKRAAAQEFGTVATELLDWLAGLLCAPMSLRTVAACRSSKGTVLFNAIHDELGEMPGIDAMRLVFDADESDAHLAARLSGCYMRLFEGLGGLETVSLYESSYAGTTRRLHQEASAAMEVVLRRCDKAVRAGCGEPPDHLALEAGLLATLLRVGDEDAADELRRRMLRWVPQACAACAGVDTIGFYRGALIALNDMLMALRAASTVRTSHARPG
jgi:TorA-specific chaperone